jgi:hypothetical protein
MKAQEQKFFGSFFQKRTLPFVRIYPALRPMARRDARR